MTIMDNPKWFLFGVFFNLYMCEAYKILAVFPMPSKSHAILGDSMVNHLVEAGHEVTYVTPFVKKEVHLNLHQIDLSENIKLFNENSMNIKLIMDKKLENVMAALLIEVAANTLRNKNMQKLMRDPEQKFDVVIGEWMFSDLYSSLAAVFDCPLIWFSTIEPHWIILNLVDGPLNPAFAGDHLNDHVYPLSFTERVQELWAQVNGLLRTNFKFYYQEEEIYYRIVAPVLKEKGKPVPSYEELRYNASLVLGNTQVAIGDAFSLPQSYKHIGGYHIDEDVKPLPEDLKKLMDNTEQGVIYFSMGSIIKSKDLPVELKRGILKVFGNLKQTVIWKFEEVLPDIPKNVHIVKWAPQQSILAHPNLVLFVTHGGLLSLTETIHFGVPVISIPVFADQFMNAVRAEKKGYGKKVDLTYTLPEDLKIALDELLSNPKYSEKAKELSIAYHDRPLKPKEELDCWVKHVVRTRGAQHLRSPAVQMPLYQRLYADLIALLLVLILILKKIVKKILSWSFRMKIQKRREKTM